MKIGTILFTYHRSMHTKKVLDALSNNSILPQRLYIFQDGVKENTNINEWNKVGEVIHNVDWCDTEIHISNKNRGLAKSITSGMDYVLNECDAAIVLEDDCVPDIQFMQFMVEALETYQNEKDVYSVSGYAWDIKLPEDEYDAYFNGRACSLGWGTWKNRWSQYEEDYDILGRIKNNINAYNRLSIWGNDLETMLAHRVTGKNNSWAVFWALKVIEKGGYCLNSHKQLVHNIGFDGSGENSGIKFDRYKPSEKAMRGMYEFPHELKCSKACEEEFQFLFGGKHGEEKLKLYQQFLMRWLTMKQKLCITEERKKGVAVWGKGPLLDCLVQEHDLTVQCIIETWPSIETYRGIPIISVYELPQYIQNVIVIPYFDIHIIKHKLNKIRPDICVMGLDELLL